MRSCDTLDLLQLRTELLDVLDLQLELCDRPVVLAGLRPLLLGAQPPAGPAASRALTPACSSPSAPLQPRLAFCKRVTHTRSKMN